MNMILNPAHDQRRRIQITRDAGEIGMCLCTKFRVLEEWLTMLCGKHQMDVDLHQ